MTRDAAIPVLNAVLAAPITRTVRQTPTELRLGPEDGMPEECPASLDNLRVVPKANLVQRRGFEKELARMSRTDVVLVDLDR